MRKTFRMLPLLVILIIFLAFTGCGKHITENSQDRTDTEDTDWGGRDDGPALTKEDYELIDEGFKIFTEETFEGNGRTCGTCHLPEKNFNISPADIAGMTDEEKAVVFASSVPELENETLVEKFAIFNINEEHAPGYVDEPEGPFRASMSIGGLAFTTLNNFVCRPENGCTPNGPGGLLVSNRAVDDGTRDRELGWSGDASLSDPNIFPDIPASEDCKDAIDEFNANPTDLIEAIRTFSLAAVKTHFTQSLNRVPGVDFRCPTAQELDALAAFQEWLGRRFELDLAEITFAQGSGESAGWAEEGKLIFMDRRAACNACHVNAGASDTQGRVKLGPVPVLPAEPLIGFDEPLQSPPSGANKNSRTGTDFLRLPGFNPDFDLDSIADPVIIPRDRGDKLERGGNVAGGRQGGFNVQSLIEAPRKKGFFHNNAFTTDVEDAISHYFTNAFDQSQGGAAIRNAFRDGSFGPETLEALGGTEALNKMGFFLRSLSAVYSIADCERLVEQMIARIDLGVSTDLPRMLCGFALNDVENVLEGAHVSPNPNSPVFQQVMDIRALLTSYDEMHSAETGGNTLAKEEKKVLSKAVTMLQVLRHSIALTPELP